MVAAQGSSSSLGAWFSLGSVSFLLLQLACSALSVCSLLLACAVLLALFVLLDGPLACRCSWQVVGQPQLALLNVRAGAQLAVGTL